jgi:DNA-binding NtrC family response regulator
MEPAESSLPTGREVLVVEDEARVRSMLSQALKDMGFNATLTSCAEAATRALGQKTFDILMLDLNLPGMNGIDFLELIRRQQNHIQVIILTGFGDLEAARKAIHHDVVEFLTKPCALGSLESALDRARKRRKAQIIGAGAAPAEAGDPPARLQFDPPPSGPLTPKGVELTAAPDEAASLDDVEQRHILGLLSKHNGNRAATAAELGISLRTLYYRLNEYQKKGLVP